MTAYRPTRSCPHPLCRPLHLIAGTGAVLAISALAPISPWILGTVAVGALFSVGIYQLVHRQTLVASIREELDETVTVTARPGWARAAAAMDAVWTLLVLAMLAAALTDRTSAGWKQAPSRTVLLASVAAGVILTAVAELLHRRAVHVTPVQAGGER